MFLDSTSKSITVVVDGAAVTSESDVTAHYVDYTSNTTTPGEIDERTNGTTAVTAVPAPAAGTQRHVKYMSINNADTVAHTFVVAYVNAGNVRRVVAMTLAAQQTVQYTQAAGWQFVPQENPPHLDVSTTVTAENMFTDALPVRVNEAVSVSVRGSGWSASVVLQRMLDGVTWNTVTIPADPTGWTGPIEMTYIVDETGYLRLGVAAGSFVSGSIPVRLGVN